MQSISTKCVTFNCSKVLLQVCSLFWKGIFKLFLTAFGNTCWTYCNVNESLLLELIGPFKTWKCINSMFLFSTPLFLNACLMNGETFPPWKGSCRYQMKTGKKSSSFDHQKSNNIFKVKPSGLNKRECIQIHTQKRNRKWLVASMVASIKLLLVGMAVKSQCQWT